MTGEDTEWYPPAESAEREMARRRRNEDRHDRSWAGADDDDERKTKPLPQGDWSNASGGQRCRALSKTSGERCRDVAIPGARVCKHHGGSSPQVRRKAQMNLLQLVDPAIVTLHQEMESADKSADRQRAANSILDRAGVARVTHVNDDGARDMLLDRLRQIKANAEQVTDDSSSASATDEIVEAELVPVDEDFTAGP